MARRRQFPDIRKRSRDSPDIPHRRRNVPPGRMFALPLSTLSTATAPPPASLPLTGKLFYFNKGSGISPAGLIARFDTGANNRNYPFPCRPKRNKRRRNTTGRRLWTQIG
jgi:hypothetical protein